MKTWENRIQNEKKKNPLNIRVAPVYQKIRESCLTWFNHFKRRSSSYFIGKKLRVSWFKLRELKKKMKLYILLIKENMMCQHSIGDFKYRI